MKRNKPTGPGVAGYAGWIAGALFILFAGCAGGHTAKRFVGWEGVYEGGTYPPVFEKWTREGRLYRGLDLELLAHATYRSREYRNAYVQEFARVYQLSEMQKIALEKESAAAHRRAHEFVLAIYVPDKQWDDLDQKEGSWKLYLDPGDGDRIPPLSVQKKKPDAAMKHFFPYISPWRTVYSVHFPKTASPTGDSAVRLIITGVRGSVEMEWPLES